MKCGYGIMIYTSTLLELLLLSLTAGKSHNGLSSGQRAVSPDAAPLGVGQITTTMPNYFTVTTFKLATAPPTPAQGPTTMAANTHPGKIVCNCNREGTLDPEDCDRLTGQCVCVAGYTGSRCQRCQDDHFSTGSAGCLSCLCDPLGALSSQCDSSSGICRCKRGVYGDKCDECHPGFYNLSSTGCQACQCNNHSTSCQSQSGICLNCQGNTVGPRCEECKYSFYRRPGAALTEVCVPCPCSSVTSSGICHIDSSGHAVCDLCQPEYQGRHCDHCRDGYFNSDSICVPCNCSGNAAPRSLPRVCHPDTGRCLSCTNNTNGPNCEHCAEGYAGDALAGSCTLDAMPTTTSPEASMTSPSTSGAATTLTFHSDVTTPSGAVGTVTSSGGLRLSTVAGGATLLPPLTATNGTTSPLGEVTWSQFNVVVLAAVVVVLVVLMGVAGGIYTFREYRSRKINAPFWTIELKEDNISFSSYHDSIPNMDVSALLEEELVDMVPSSQLTLSSSGYIYRA